MDQDKQREEAFLGALQLACGSVIPMVLTSAIELDLLELIKKASPGASASASASELAAQLPTKNPNAAPVLDRMLRLLSANSVIKSSYKKLPGGGIERRYSLGPICNLLTRDENGASLAPTVLMTQNKVFMETWYYLKDAVLEGGDPFEKAHGMGLFEHGAKNPKFSNIFNQGMSNYTSILILRILEKYKGFDGLKSLVDVGGGTGANMEAITSKYPIIRGINFDLPHVIQKNPSYPGIEHVGGDMFVSVPEGDAIFMRGILHDWDDANCVKILKNCYKALPENGKVINADYILSEDSSSGEAACGALSDMAMLAYCPSGKERTEEEFQALAKQAGFKKFHKVCCAYATWIMEFCK